MIHTRSSREADLRTDDPSFSFPASSSFSRRIFPAPSSFSRLFDPPSTDTSLSFLHNFSPLWFWCHFQTPCQQGKRESDEILASSLDPRSLLPCFLISRIRKRRQVRKGQHSFPRLLLSRLIKSKSVLNCFALKYKDYKVHDPVPSPVLTKATCFLFHICLPSSINTTCPQNVIFE